MNKHYAYSISGTASGGQTWTSNGTLYCEFHEVFDNAVKATFDDLTKGKAIYGKPGVGCRGPYDITSVTIIQKKEAKEEKPLTDPTTIRSVI